MSDPGIGVLLETSDYATAHQAVTFELACRGYLLGEAELSPANLWSISSNLLLELAPEITRLGVASDRVRAATGSGEDAVFPLSSKVARTGARVRVSSPFPEIRDGIRLGLFDPNPRSAVEAHPDKSGNAVSLGGHSQEAWLARLRSVMSIVEEHLPELWQEMRYLLRLVVPTGAHEEKQLSASYREYIGAFYVTLHPQVLSMTEALIHEFQHNKLNLCTQHYELIENGVEPLYASPVRPDPRPLDGILLAAHAFVPVAELYCRMAERAEHASGLMNRLSDVVRTNHEALTTLEENARWTKAGAAVRDELWTWHERHRQIALA
jgi:HEXXH motif-containing protein